MANKKFTQHEDELFACLVYAAFIWLLICIVASIFSTGVYRWIFIGFCIYDLAILYILWALSPMFFKDEDYIKYEEIV